MAKKGDNGAAVEAASFPAWIPQELRKYLLQPTMPIPIAGKLVGIKSRGGSYNAAERGEIPTMKFGRSRPVPTWWVRKQIGLDA